jgi:N-acetylmuramoyl-L-alanine amidase
MYRYLFFTILILLSLPSLANDITAIRMGQHPDKSRIVFDISGAMDFSAQIKNSPQRLVVHVPVKNWRVSGDSAFASPFMAVQQSQITENFTQITVPLSAPHIIQSAFMIAGAPHRLVVDMTPANDLEFKRQLSIIHGPLRITKDTGDDLGDLIASFKNNPTPYPESKPVNRPKPVIMIDAGHGGKDPGAISPSGIQEKNITLPMARRIAKILNDSGRYDAQLTRDDDRFIKLYNRVKIARNANADMFISIHADSVGNHVTRGASVYTLSDTASDAQTAKLAARENQADLIGGMNLNIEDADVSAILIDLSMRESMNQSKIIASKVISNFRTKGVETLKGPHRYAGFAVLKAPDVPSILIETGFVSNEAQARELTSPKHQIKIATAILKSLDKYFGYNE